MDQEERKKEKKKDIKEGIFIKHVPFKTMWNATTYIMSC